MAKLDKVKQISFSTQILMQIERRIKEIGVSFPEYIRYLVLNDVRNIRDNIPYVSEADEKNIKKSMQNLSEGDFTILKNKNEIRQHYTNLLSDKN